MIRAGVFIGVDKSGQLQRLADAAAGARRMYEWALAQGMQPNTHAKLFTDEGDRNVSPFLIYRAIEELVDGPGVDQLILYFAGHGVNIQRSEQWLLSDAPKMTSAAIDVSRSAELARYCGIGHVVIISDACRTAAEGIQAQGVRGIEVFPNEGGGDRAKPVDQFFACVLGRPAAEISDPALAARSFRALYTSALLDALMGARRDVLEPSNNALDTASYVKPERLQKYLESEIPLRVQALRLNKRINQTPDAILTIHQNWLSRIESPPGEGTRSLEGPPVLGPTHNLAAVIRRFIHAAASGNASSLRQEIRRAKLLDVAGAERLAASVENLVEPFGPDQFKSRCGIKTRGERIVDWFAPLATCELLGTDGHLLQVNDLSGPAASILLRFERSGGALIPAISGFVATLTFDSGELVDVAYEPSANTARGEAYAENATQIRAIRAVAAAASQYDRFRIDTDVAEDVFRAIRYANSIDPTLAVYAAYAYHDVQDIDTIRGLSERLASDVGVSLFDVALAGRQLVGTAIDANLGVIPRVPLLARGWALLGSNRVDLPVRLHGIERTLRESVWSLFDREGVELLRRAMETGDVQ